MPAIAIRMQTENARLTSEIARRVELLKTEVDTWTQQVSLNLNGLGIHRSQFDALGDLMREILDRQAPRVAALQAAASLAKFSAAYLQAVDDIIGGQDVWRIFRTSMDQRSDPTLRRTLDAADLVAADCYLSAMRRAKSLAIVDEARFRQPPLVCLNVSDSPAAAGRGETFESQFKLQRYRDMLLPIPIVLLPSDHLACVWLLCSLHHEVGHSLAQDFALEPALKGLVLARLPPTERSDVWWSWTGEIVADAFGVQLGGVGFAQALAAWLMVLATSGRCEEIDPRMPHPNPYVRIPLLCAMLRAQKIAAVTAAADEIESAWSALTKPQWVDAFLGDVGAIVQIFLDTAIPPLKDHTLREIVPVTDADIALVQQLAGYLLKRGVLPASAPADGDLRGRHHWVPVAAQMALSAAKDAAAGTLDRIQKNALEHIERIERPDFLAAVPAAAQRDFYRTLARGLDFTSR